MPPALSSAGQVLLHKRGFSAHSQLEAIGMPSRLVMPVLDCRVVAEEIGGSLGVAVDTLGLALAPPSAAGPAVMISIR